MLGLSKILKLDTLSYILDRATTLGPVALVILFLPELRQALEGFGKLLPQRIGTPERTVDAHSIEEIVASASEMAEGKVGALIVVEREAHLDPVISNGSPIDATVSAPLLVSIFYEGNPLHDGAVVIRGNRIVAAACRLPNSESMRIDPHVHLRHRAAVGVTEANDCLVIVVSEERGRISLAIEGRLTTLSGSDELRSKLNQLLRGDEPKRTPRRRSKPQKRSPVKNLGYAKSEVESPNGEDTEGLPDEVISRS